MMTSVAALPSNSSSSPILLFRNARGSARRRVAVGGLVLSVLVILTLVITTALRARQGDALPPLPMVLVTLIALISGVVGFSSVSLARRYVTYFELWPKRNLALVRTAGLWTEKTHLVPWHDFRVNRSVISAKSRDPYLRVHLRSGKHLAFEQPTGEAPRGWNALQEFVESCHAPIDKRAGNELSSPSPDAIPSSFERNFIAG
jgi:hypothetical protein